MTILAAIGTILLQIVLAIHVVRTNKPLFWIFIILLFPLLGSLVYIVAVLIPEWERTNAIQIFVHNIERFYSELISGR